MLDKTKYNGNCFSIMNTNKFKKFDKNRTVSYETKIQRTLRNMKSRLTLQEYIKVYPTGSNAGKVCNTAKIRKLPESRTVDQLSLRPIVSNIGTASYYLAKHIGKMLVSLSKSDYSVQKSKDFVNLIKPRKIPNNHQLISFDVISLFTNVPIDTTIDIIYSTYLPIEKNWQKNYKKWNERAHTAMH